MLVEGLHSIIMADIIMTARPWANKLGLGTRDIISHNDLMSGL